MLDAGLLLVYRRPLEQVLLEAALPPAPLSADPPSLQRAGLATFVAARSARE